MGFFVALFVNSILLSVPIGATLGVLFAIRPFDGERRVHPNSVMPGLVTATVCDEWHTFVQNKEGQNYTLNSNQILAETGSTLCSTITTFENVTYPAALNTSMPEFSVTWNYPFRLANSSTPTDEPAPAIHAFPQARIADPGSVLPLRLGDLLVVDLDFAWHMGVGKDRPYATSRRNLAAHKVDSTVVLDMYMDRNETRAADATEAAFEIIVFFARFTEADPVGFGNGTIIRTEELGGNQFHLFVGKNARGQAVFSWVSTGPLYQFRGDVSRLFDSVIALRDDKRIKVNVPTFDDFLGYVGFGTQAFSADDDVTFYVPRLSINVRKL